MQPRVKKLICAIFFMPVMLLYLGAVLAIGDMLPQHWFVMLVFYVIMGTIWAFPLKPIMKWMNAPAPTS